MRAFGHAIPWTVGESLVKFDSVTEIMVVPNGVVEQQAGRVIVPYQAPEILPLLLVQYLVPCIGGEVHFRLDHGCDCNGFVDRFLETEIDDVESDFVFCFNLGFFFYSTSSALIQDLQPT